jgi:hypothetical protein
LFCFSRDRGVRCAFVEGGKVQSSRQRGARPPLAASKERAPPAKGWLLAARSDRPNRPTANKEALANDVTVSGPASWRPRRHTVQPHQPHEALPRQPRRGPFTTIDLSIMHPPVSVSMYLPTLRIEPSQPSYITPPLPPPPPRQAGLALLSGGGCVVCTQLGPLSLGNLARAHARFDSHRRLVT